MSVHEDRGAYVVRWREDGQQRSRRFGTREEAEQHDAVIPGRLRRAKRIAAAEYHDVAIGWIDPDGNLMPEARRMDGTEPLNVGPTRDAP